MTYAVSSSTARLVESYFVGNTFPCYDSLIEFMKNQNKVNNYDDLAEYAEAIRFILANFSLDARKALFAEHILFQLQNSLRLRY